MKDMTLKQALGTGIKFHPELRRVKKEELMCVPIVLQDAKIIDDWDGTWGTSEFALLRVEIEDTKESVTTLCGGKAVVRQVNRLQKQRRLPGRLRCFLNKVEGPNGLYYVLDSDEEKAEDTVKKSPVEVTQ